MSHARILAVDPGSEQSAWVVYDPVARRLHGFGIVPNHDMFAVMGARAAAEAMVIEEVQSYGMAVGKTVFDTVFWAGRFAQFWDGIGGAFHLYPRRQVKLELCGQARAKDGNVRQALIDRFGPGKRAAVGLKACPGPLYGVKKDIWAALALAVAWCDANGKGA